MLIENLSPDWRTPAALAEQAEAAAGPQPAAQEVTQQQRPDREALLAEALGLIGAMSPELRTALADFMTTEILRDDQGRIRRPTDISARLLTIAYLASPRDFRSLASIGERLGLSRTIMCKHASRFCERLGFAMPPPPHPGNADGPRGAARQNHLSRLGRRGELEIAADKILADAGLGTKRQASE